jgi:hypothetical protein
MEGFIRIGAYKIKIIVDSKVKESEKYLLNPDESIMRGNR